MVDELKRIINVYQIINDALITEISINDIDFDVLYKIIGPPFKDPLLWDTYRLTTEQVIKINDSIIGKVDIKADIHYYVLVCKEHSDWLF